MILKIATIILLQVSMMNLIGKLSSSKMLHKKEFVITTVIFSILYSCLDGIFEKGIITIFSMIYLALTSKIFLKLNNKDLIFYVVITWILGVVIDIMTMLIMSLWHITEHINEENNSIFQSICTAVMILIYLLCAKSKFVNKTINKLKKLKNRINSFYYKLIAIIAIYFILGLICFNNMGNKEIPIIVLVIAISLLLILIIFIIQQFQINSLQENIILLTKNNEFYIEFIDKYRILKHNLISNLNSIKSVANEDTKTLINDLIHKYNKELKLPTNFKELPTGVNGIVYSSKPLVYNGSLIEDFYLEFKDGEVVNFDAKTGKETLKQIIEYDENSKYLGEVALVDYDSQISKSNLVFYETLYDENAACHLALGSSYLECIKEPDFNIVNKSSNHVDFMIGTKDLEVYADDELIVKDGNFIK